MPVRCSIITIGDELLIGQTIDTNSAWMGQELNKAGVWLHRRVAVGDDREAIREALDEEGKHSDLILITGGLGPTADDITKPVLCEYFAGKMITDEKVLAHIYYLFEKIYNRPGPILERNLKQAEVPDVCTVLFNERGSAPGMWFEKEGKIYVSLPGVPHEMKGLMLQQVLPRIPQYFTLPYILHRTAFTAGRGESMIAESIQDFETALPPEIKLAYLPNYGMVRLRLTASGSDKALLEKTLDEQFAILKERVADILVTDTDNGLDVVIGQILKEKGKTMGTAESCTGGYIAHLVSAIPGASAYFKGAVVSYANETKVNLLGVSETTLSDQGAVSEQTVKEMVSGALRSLKVDYAVAVSGIMGPDGGTADKPVGTVWIAVADHSTTQTQCLHFRFDRERNIHLTAQNALNMLRKFILAQE